MSDGSEIVIPILSLTILIFSAMVMFKDSIVTYLMAKSLYYRNGGQRPTTFNINVNSHNIEKEIEDE